MLKVSRNLSILMLVNRDTSVSLANATGLSRNIIDYARLGKHCPRLDTISVIAQHYGVPVDFFINGKITLCCDNWSKEI